MSESKTGILHGDEPPGWWQHAAVFGGAISYELPQGFSVDGFEVPEDECLALVLEKQGEYGDEDRDVTVWVVSYPPDRILLNWRDTSTELGTYESMQVAADEATEWMRDHSGIG